MTVYTASGNTATTWNDPIESIWQGLTGGPKRAGGKRTDLGISERLFIGAVMNQPREQRPWGMVTWLGKVYGTSRPHLAH